MDSKSPQKEINLLNKILEKYSQKIDSLEDLSQEEKLSKIINVM
jgi:hypothetical protein